MHKPTEKTTRGPLRALSDWLRGTPPPAPSGVDPAAPAAREGLPSRIGHYAITGKLGQGGMGVVYAARDERLERSVAVKTMSSAGRRRDGAQALLARGAGGGQRQPSERLPALRDRRGRGRAVHRHGAAGGRSRSAERLQRGPLSVAEALPIGLGILAALSALHARGIVHRDLKPSNVFLTPHGVKLLDFGLARPSDSDLSPALPAATELTRTGMVLGTPRYMAPEQVTGEGLDARSDLFAVGAILFEMLAGRPAFGGRNAVEILHATLYEQPPALTGSPAVAAVDRVIRRALAKRPAERPASAEAMAEELRAVRGMDGDAVARPGPHPDAPRGAALPHPAPRSRDGLPGLQPARRDRHVAVGHRLARRALERRRRPLRRRSAGPQGPGRRGRRRPRGDGDARCAPATSCGPSAQLVEAPGGTLLTSHTVQSSLGDLFQLQDDIARRVVEALALPLGAQDLPTPAAPHNARAYELYLRANELARSYGQLRQARELYEQCLELDPGFAPAWAQLGRCHRVIGKFIEATGDSTDRAEAAFRRALELNPRLSVAHKYYAHLEAETGQPRAALVRLLGEATRHGNDPELFAGLVHACRYCGLFEQSIAAHEEARRLDPNVPSSLEQTILMTGDIERLLAVAEPVSSARQRLGIRVIGLGLAGRRDEARRSLAEHRQAAEIPVFKTYGDNLMAWLDRRPTDMVARAAALGALKIMDDPEAIFQIGWLLCDVGEHERGLDHLRRAVAKGYTVAPTLATAPAFDALRGDPAFRAVLAEAEAGREQALPRLPGARRRAASRALSGRTARACQ